MAGSVAFRIATFNAGLAVGVLPHVTERLPRVVAALAELDVDLLFVQEFWLESHWERLVRALQSRLPHAFRPEPMRAGARPACREKELQALSDCAQRHCRGLTDEALARCMVRHCAPQGLALSSQCLNCITSNPVGSFEQIVGRCLERRGETAAGPFAPSPEARRLVAYGGSFGTGLLARSALEVCGSLAFEASINARGATCVRVPLRKHGNVFVFATHLSPGGAEQEPQVRRLLAWIAELSADGPAILMGDLNTTPGSKFFRAFEKAGFHETELVDGRATFTLAGLESGIVDGSGYRLDHVLMRDIGPARTERILDRPITFSVEGRLVRTTLSDHFGLRAVFDDALDGVEDV
jgi:endonuclease/exonuclease/phosphatase family metal-dependent hydrolase